MIIHHRDEVTDLLFERLLQLHNRGKQSHKPTQVELGRQQELLDLLVIIDGRAVEFWVDALNRGRIEEKE